MFKKNFYCIVIVVIVLHLSLFLGCDDGYKPEKNNLSSITNTVCYDCGIIFYNSTKGLNRYTFINNTTNNLIFSYYHKQKKSYYTNNNFKTNNNAIIYDNLRWINPTIGTIVFYDEQYNFIFRITNFITNIPSHSRIETITNYYGIVSNLTSIIEIRTNTFIEIENSTLTNAYYGTTNE